MKIKMSFPIGISNPRAVFAAATATIGGIAVPVSALVAVADRYQITCDATDLIVSLDVAASVQTCSGTLEVIDSKGFNVYKNFVLNNVIPQFTKGKVYFIPETDSDTTGLVLPCMKQVVFDIANNVMGMVEQSHCLYFATDTRSLINANTISVITCEIERSEYLKYQQSINASSDRRAGEFVQAFIAN